MASVDKFRSSLGAVQNRLDSAIANLNNTTTNLSEAQSLYSGRRLCDRSVQHVKAQIIQQARVTPCWQKPTRYRSRFCLCCRVNRCNLIN
ncbi:flagellin [Escherichia coli]